MSDLDGTEMTGGNYGDPEPRSDGGGLRQQLEAALRREAELKQRLDTELPAAEQRGAQQAQRRFEVLKIVGDERPGLADAFINQHRDGDVNREVVAEFAKSFGVSLDDAPAPEQQVPAEVQSAAQTFHAAGSTGGVAETMGRDEYLKKLQDPSTRGEAQAALREGRVKFNHEWSSRAGSLGQR